MREIPHSPVALYKAANLFGTLIAETILASVHVRARKQAGHMDASDLINAAAKHLARRRPSTYGECRLIPEGQEQARLHLKLNPLWSHKWGPVHFRHSNRRRAFSLAAERLKTCDTSLPPRL